MYCLDFVLNSVTSRPDCRSELCFSLFISLFNQNYCFILIYYIKIINHLVKVCFKFIRHLMKNKPPICVRLLVLKYLCLPTITFKLSCQAILGISIYKEVRVLYY